MRSAHHVEWHGVRYTVQPLKSNSRVPDHPPVWAVSRRGEFIGTLPYRAEETTTEFEIRCLSWLQDLLGTRRAFTRRH
jgi:hypothetical protein